jgi:hypothetical protein
MLNPDPSAILRDPLKKGSKMDQNGSYASEDSSQGASDIGFDDDDDLSSTCEATRKGGSANDKDASGGDDIKEEVKRIEALANQDTRNLIIWKVTVMAIVIATFAAVTCGTYIFIHKEQLDDDEEAVCILKYENLLLCGITHMFIAFNIVCTVRNVYRRVT